jgi:hypothetical protein
MAAATAGAAAQQPERGTDSGVLVTADSLHAAVGREFAAADSNRDGVLTSDELRASAHRIERSEYMGLSLINWPGWGRIAAERGGRIAPEDMTAAYIGRLEDLDRDGDGALTRAEMQASGSERMLIVCPARGNAGCPKAERRMEAIRQSRLRSGRDFERLDWRVRGYYRFNSALDRPLYTAVRDYRSWHAMWDSIVARHGPKPLSPAVDFSKDMILIAATGSKPSGGYAIRIVSVRETGKELVATAVRISPGPRCGATAAIIAPADIVRVPISRKPVRWTFRDRLTDCS